MAKSKTTAMTKWDEELARDAERYAKQEAGTLGGQFISIRGGNLQVDDAPIPNNEMGVVILDAVLENTFFDTDFDPDEPRAPACYAFGREEDELKPHEEARDPQAESCEDCEHNRWGTADRGRGKACRNRRRLAVIAGGTMRDGRFEPFSQADQVLKAQQYLLALPPTSLRGYAAYVRQLATVLQRPPYAVFTKVSVVPDPKSQFKVVFELLDPVPRELFDAVHQRHGQAAEEIIFPYPELEALAPEQKAKKAKKAKSRGKGRAAGRAF